MRFWFNYTIIQGRLVIMDVSETYAYGRSLYTASWSEDPRVCFLDLSPEIALAKLVAHLEAHVLAPHLHVTFLPQAQPTAVPA